MNPYFFFGFHIFKDFFVTIMYKKYLKIIIDLGKIGFDACVYYFKSNYEFKEKIKFVHGKIYKLPKNILLVGCYHPSPRNVNTGRINENKMTNLFKRILKLVD